MSYLINFGWFLAGLFAMAVFVKGACNLWPWDLSRW